MVVIGKLIGPCIMVLISIFCYEMGKSYSKYTRNLKMYDSIRISYDKSFSIIDAKYVIVDSHDSLGFNNTIMLMRKMDSLNNIEKEKREKYGTKNIHKGNR